MKRLLAAFLTAKVSNTSEAPLIAGEMNAEKEAGPSPEGTFKWTLDLKPGEKRELTVKFSVDYPNELPVTGVET